MVKNAWKNPCPCIILVGIPSSLGCTGWGVLFNRHNLLSMMKVICWWSIICQVILRKMEIKRNFFTLKEFLYFTELDSINSMIFIQLFSCIWLWNSSHHRPQEKHWFHGLTFFKTGVYFSIALYLYRFFTNIGQFIGTLKPTYSAHFTLFSQVFEKHRTTVF